MKMDYCVPRFFLAAVLACSFLVVGCSAPKRASYEGADSVGAFSAGDLVGRWNVTVLNPIDPDENNQTVTYVFNKNGTWVTSVVPDESRTAVTGPMTIEASGTWTIADTLVNSTIDEIKETSGSNYAPLIQAFVKPIIEKIAGSVDPYEITKNRIVLVDPKSGQASLLERL